MPRGRVKSLRTLIDDGRAFDAVVVVLATWFVLGAYITAYAYVIVPNSVETPAKTAGATIVDAAWSLLIVYLFIALAAGLNAGKAWNRALPDGHTATLVAALAFGAAWIGDYAFWSPAFGSGGLGLEMLFTPPHIVEMGAAGVIVSGPLRAAARRGESTASPMALTSAALLLSVLTFATQFMHPMIDPWAAADYQFGAAAPRWLGENIGVAGILTQSALLAGTGLLLNSGFTLRRGSLTYVFTLNGLLVTITKLHLYLLPVSVVTGLAADGWLAWTARRPGKPSASLCAVVGGGFAAAYMIEVLLLPAGTAWDASLWSGTILAAAALCWMMGRLLRAGLPAALIAPWPAFMLVAGEPAGAAPVLAVEVAAPARAELVKAALDDLGTPEALGRSPLARAPGLSRGGSAASDLRAALVDAISELAGSASPRDAESGRLLLDYYVKRVGSHEVIMERLHLSRPTYYRRLDKGFELVAARLDELSGASVRT